jgi:hypothetical protein
MWPSSWPYVINSEGISPAALQIGGQLGSEDGDAENKRN